MRPHPMPRPEGTRSDGLVDPDETTLVHRPGPAPSASTLNGTASGRARERSAGSDPAAVTGGPSGSPTSPSTSETTPSSAASVLVVEDNPQNRRLARALLRLEGFHVVEAEDARAALRRLEHHLPDLILMDIQMPGMDGVELTRLLRAHDRTRDIPILALTAYAMRGDRERFVAAGCDGYISKPIDPATLPGLVKNHLGSP